MFTGQEVKESENPGEKYCGKHVLEKTKKTIVLEKPSVRKP